MCVYTHNSILIRIMMLMPDCSNCSQVILAKYTMLLSLTHFSDLFWIIVILLTLKKPIYDICGLYYFYTRINFFLQFLFIILFEWFYFIMCPNHFFLKKNDSSLKKEKKERNWFRLFNYWIHWNIESFFLDFNLLILYMYMY